MTPDHTEIQGPSAEERARRRELIKQDEANLAAKEKENDNVEGQS